MAKYKLDFVKYRHERTYYEVWCNGHDLKVMLCKTDRYSFEGSGYKVRNDGSIVKNLAQSYPSLSEARKDIVLELKKQQVIFSD